MKFFISKSGSDWAIARIGKWGGTDFKKPYLA